jgi:hypothetical protein
MLETAMHKHISNQLGRIKIRCHKKVQSQQVVQVNSILHGYHAAKETQHIYYQ